jgi:NifB/MoaA-like Fe-S oxidoreductase
MKEFANLPIYKDTRKLVNDKRVELIYKRGKNLTLTEIADEIVKIGVSLIK